ncbi:hypothetical protein D0T53_11800 [Dysgonomonas sp. 216]|uniref:hypothetical protein n=1 Tax=Dysgonomonas sp. 216 TaxID=2302934 RepID=UPI0013D38933|nr:hypothetical protein [Dysgonomonas sp. 216]NDW19590.1 hypothetical protein [Dysgonomonas sp. 216]
MKTSSILNSIIVLLLLITCNAFRIQAQEKQYRISPKALDIGVYDYSKVKKCPYKIYYAEEADEKFNERLMSDERLRNFKPFAEYITIVQEDDSTIYVREQEAYEYCPELEYVMITGGHGFVSAYDLRTSEEIFVNPSSYVYSPSGKYRFGTFEYDGMNYYIEVKEGNKYVPYGIDQMNTDLTGVYWVDDNTIHYLSEKERADGSKYHIGYSTKFYRSTGENIPLEGIQAENEVKTMDNSINWKNRSKVFYTTWKGEDGKGYHVSKTRRIFIVDDQVFIREFIHGDSRMYKIQELNYQGDSVITAMIDFDYMAFAQYPDVLAGRQTLDWKEMHNPGKSIKKIVLTKDKSTLLWSINTEDFASDSSLWIDSYDILPSGHYYQNQRTTPHNPDNENFLPIEKPLFSGKYELDEEPIEIDLNTKTYKTMEHPYEGTWLHISKTDIGDVVYDYPARHDESNSYDRLIIKIKGDVIAVRYLNSMSMTDSIKFDRVLFYPNSGSYRFYPWAEMCYEFKWIDKKKHICQWTIYHINWNTRHTSIWGQRTYINKAYNNLPVITYDWE